MEMQQRRWLKYDTRKGKKSERIELAGYDDGGSR
jgi:hypothetical protein